MTSKPPPPSPAHILRSHSAPVRVLAFSDDNERLYSGDAEGTVVITNTRSLRPLAVWQAHSDGLLGVQEWEEHVITYPSPCCLASTAYSHLNRHGRDNKLHVWERVLEAVETLGQSAAPLGLQTPRLRYSMDVNALNYCRFSLMPLADSARSDGQHVLIALPNLVESSFVCACLTQWGLNPMHFARRTYGLYRHRAGSMPLWVRPARPMALL